MRCFKKGHIGSLLSRPLVCAAGKIQPWPCQGTGIHLPSISENIFHPYFFYLMHFSGAKRLTEIKSIGSKFPSSSTLPSPKTTTEYVTRTDLWVARDLREMPSPASGGSEAASIPGSTRASGGCWSPPCARAAASSPRFCLHLSQGVSLRVWFQISFFQGHQSLD